MDAKKYIKHIPGFVSQIFTRQDDGKYSCTDQIFEAGDPVERELDDLDSTPLDDEEFDDSDEIYQPCTMVQPVKDKNEIEMDYYLLIITGDVEPELDGPFSTEKERDKAALAHREKDPNAHDGIFHVQCPKGTDLHIGSYRGIFFSE